MTGIIPRPSAYDLLHAGLLLLCLCFPACQSAGEPYAGPTALDPKITVVETPLADLWGMAASGALTDLKTLALVLTLRSRRPDLFA